MSRDQIEITEADERLFEAIQDAYDIPAGYARDSILMLIARHRLGLPLKDDADPPAGDKG